MQGAILAASELAYLLETLNAKQVVGLDAPELFPTETAERDALVGEGFRQLQAHGWLRQLEKHSQYDLNANLLYMAAVVAAPQFVIFTIRTQADGSSRVLLHYLAEPDIVELLVTAQQKYALALVPDRAGMLNRIQEMLGLPEPAQRSEVRFMIEEPTFETIQDLAEDGQTAEAAALLKQFGINGHTGASLVKALEAPETSGLVVVVRPNRGQIEAGRKASLFRDVDVVWLAKRVDAKSNTFSVETVQADTLPNVLDAYLEFLAH